jgi:glycosyltransferase involved in cell wall biosynthesis
MMNNHRNSPDSRGKSEEAVRVKADAYEQVRVTVAVTTHNRCELLKRALASALKQTYRNLEVLVSDDGSTDGTRDWMVQQRDARVRYVRMEKAGGIAANFQNALDHAVGELFMILNDDDELEPGAIEGLARPFAEGCAGVEREEVVLSWCPCKIQDAERRVRYVTGGGPEAEPGIDLVTGLFDGVRGPRYCGILVRRRDAAEVGFSGEHGPIPDVGNWTRVAVRAGMACCVNEPLARYTAHDASCTGTSTAMSWQRAGEAIVRDLLADLKRRGDEEKARHIRKSRRNFITGLLATVLMQSSGRPGWTVRVLREFMRAPQYFVTPMTVRRLLLEGGKILRKAK